MLSHGLHMSCDYPGKISVTFLKKFANVWSTDSWHQIHLRLWTPREGIRFSRFHVHLLNTSPKGIMQLIIMFWIHFKYVLMHCILQHLQVFVSPHSLFIRTSRIHFPCSITSLIPWFIVSLCLGILSIYYPCDWWFTSLRLWNWTGMSTFSNTDIESYKTKV